MRVNESGRSMIEMLGVLAIVGVLSVGGIAGYSKAMTKFKTNKVADQVSMIVTNIRTLYAQQKDYAGLNNASADSMGVLPDEVGSAAGYLNAFRGSVIVGATKLGGTAATMEGNNKMAFEVIFNGLPKETCVSLATNDWGSGYSSGLVAVKASGSALAASPDSAESNMGKDCEGVTNSIACPNGTTSKSPMNVAQAAAACSCGTSNTTCALKWKFY